MPNVAEAVLILVVVVVVFAAARLFTLGDALGYLLKNLVGRGEASEPENDSPPERDEKTESGEGTWQSRE